MCRHLKYRFEQVIRLGLYDGLLRDACIRGKSSHTQPISAALANVLWLNERAALETAQPDLVVPVPRFWTRRLTQAHHQAETISRVLSQRLRLPHARTLLHKTRLTPDQSELSAAQRKQNLRGAFSVWFGRPQIVGKTILLVDDILTTGTTANECAKTLLKAGAQKVIVAAIAIVPPYRH
jgi:ComF family protein